MKNILIKKFVLFLATLVAKPLLVLYRKTLNIKIVNRKFVDQCQSEGENIIYSFWHEHMILPLLVHENQGINVLVSQHFDGEVISRILKTFGYSTVRGSSTRGGSLAFNQMRKGMQKNKFEIAFTPDGPTGPRRKAKLGVVKLAAETGTPIIAISVAANRYKRLNTWDHLFIMSPFSKCTLAYAPPLYVKDTGNPQDLTVYTKKLNEQTNKLEGLIAKCLSS